MDFLVLNKQNMMAMPAIKGMEGHSTKMTDEIQRHMNGSNIASNARYIALIKLSYANKKIPGPKLDSFDN